MYVDDHKKSVCLKIRMIVLLMTKEEEAKMGRTMSENDDTKWTCVCECVYIWGACVKVL